MNWDLLGIAVLLTLAGLYMLESALSTAPGQQDAPVPALRPARTVAERAWLAEPVQVFLRQLLAARHRRATGWGFRPGPF